MQHMYMYVTCMQHVCNMNATCMQHVCNMCSTLQQNACHREIQTLLSGRKHVSSAFEILIASVEIHYL